MNVHNWDASLIQAIVDIQRDFIEKTDIRRAFDLMLNRVLEITESEYGFMGEVLIDDEGLPYLVTTALTDISWDKATKALYDQQMIRGGFEFHNLNSLFGVTLATGKLVISNSPKNDPRAGGLPNGHPGMKNYMGLPILNNLGFSGMVGIANKKGGYSEAMANALSPLLMTAGSMITTIRTEAKRTEIESQNTRNIQLLGSILNNIKDLVILSDHRGIIQEANQAALKRLKLSREALKGTLISQLMPKGTAAKYQRTLDQYILSGDKAHLNTKMTIEFTSIIEDSPTFELDISEAKLDHKKLFVNSFHDITEKLHRANELEKANQKLAELAIRDALTGLYNRRAFEERAPILLGQAIRLKSKLGFIAIDVDNFKQFNDQFGHPAGDLALQTIAKVLQACFNRVEDLCARFGGEEFCILVRYTNQRQLKRQLSDLLARIHATTEMECSYGLTVSLGVSILDQSETTFNDLYKAADRALYKAKAQGKAAIRFAK